MHELLALLTFALSLFGVQLGGTHYSNHLEGGAVLHSEAWADAGNARFECVESSSGRCHYRLLPRKCTNDPCGKPLRQFDVVEGKAVALSGLPDFRIEVQP